MNRTDRYVFGYLGGAMFMSGVATPLVFIHPLLMVTAFLAAAVMVLLSISAMGNEG